MNATHLIFNTDITVYTEPYNIQKLPVNPSVFTRVRTLPDKGTEKPYSWTRPTMLESVENGGVGGGC